MGGGELKEERAEGSMSDSVLPFEARKKRRSSIGEKIGNLVGLNKFQKSQQPVFGLLLMDFNIYNLI